MNTNEKNQFEAHQPTETPQSVETYHDIDSLQPQYADSHHLEGKRKFPRKPFLKPVAFLSQGKSQIATGGEIGEGGISFKTDMVLDANHAVVMNFFIPGGDFFSLRGQIKNQSQYDVKNMIYGVSFEEVSLSLKRQIRAYVARMSEDT